MRRCATLPTSFEKKVLDQIKAQPYYAVRLIPDIADRQLQAQEIEALVRQTAVRLRGWDFPHLDREHKYNTPAYLGTSIDWAQHVEFWRAYKSGQFVYIGGFWDNAMDHQIRLRAELDRVI